MCAVGIARRWFSRFFFVWYVALKNEFVQRLVVRAHKHSRSRNFLICCDPRDVSLRSRIISTSRQLQRSNEITRKARVRESKPHCFSLIALQRNRRHSVEPAYDKNLKSYAELRRAIIPRSISVARRNLWRHQATLTRDPFGRWLGITRRIPVVR
jgi:hypothetical protein